MQEYDKIQFASFANEVLATKSIVFVDEYNETHKHYAVGTDSKELANDVFSVQFCDITIVDSTETKIFSVINQYDGEQSCCVATVYEKAAL